MKKEVETLSSSIALIKDDISTLAKTVEKDNSDIFTKSWERYVDDKYIFEIPKKLWLYESEDSTYMRGLIHSNNVYFAKKSSFDVVILSRNNYKNYLSQKGAEAI